MNDGLMQLLERIKGAKLYSSPKGLRVYIPYSLDYAPRRVEVKAYFTIINDRITLCVKVYSNDYSTNWCNAETARVKETLRNNFHELLYHCESEHQKIELNERLCDHSVQPLKEVFDKPVQKALNFLYKMKVSALICEDQLQRWFIAVKLAQSRFQSGKINNLCVFMLGDNLETFLSHFQQWWNGADIPTALCSIDSISHCKESAYNHLLATIGENTMLIMDDSHLVKTPDSIRGQRLIEIASRCNYKLLTTPILVTNHVHDMYMQYRLLNEEILSYYSWNDFTRKHVIYGGNNGQQIIGYKNLAYLIDATAHYTYAVETQNKIRRELMIKTYVCDLTEKQNYIYHQRKNDLLRRIELGNYHLYDVFQSFISMQKIVCGLLPSYASHTAYTRKIELLREYDSGEPCIIICKYLFEINLLVKYLEPENCAVLSGKLREKREAEWNIFKKKQKKYLICTLSMPLSKLKYLNDSFTVVFFSLSFKFDEYQRCISYLEENIPAESIAVKRFFTTSGIDRIIRKNLDVKDDLAHEIKSLFRNKTTLKQLVETL
ncbi:hypothetical protein FACS189463_3600 [Bacteroidia bacterium]|nr:hypothetical protein FACS189463_3600 [Bacteroidia bacterium]